LHVARDECIRCNASSRNRLRLISARSPRTDYLRRTGGFKLLFGSGNVGGRREDDFSAKCESSTLLNSDPTHCRSVRSERSIPAAMSALEINLKNS
jgi:hypothetical protein